MLLVSTLAPETIGKDEVLPGSFAGSWALLCLATSSWEGKYHPLLPGLPTKDRASGINLLDYSQNTRIFFFFPAIWKKRSCKFLCFRGKAGKHNW